MLRDITITYLEMSSAAQLVPARKPPAPLRLQRLGSEDLEVFRSTCLKLGAPYGWTSRPAWSEAQWKQRLANAEVEPWLARVGESVAGLVELELQLGGAVEIVIFGLLPEFIGRGFGGHLLSVGTQRAWNARWPDHSQPKRVWLHTSSYDHPHAIENYERRGFRVVRREQRRHEVDPVIESAAEHAAPSD